MIVYNTSNYRDNTSTCFTLNHLVYMSWRFPGRIWSWLKWLLHPVALFSTQRTVICRCFSPHWNAGFHARVGKGPGTPPIWKKQWCQIVAAVNDKSSITHLQPPQLFRDFLLPESGSELRTVTGPIQGMVDCWKRLDMLWMLGQNKH